MVEFCHATRSTKMNPVLHRNRNPINENRVYNIFLSLQALNNFLEFIVYSQYNVVPAVNRYAIITILSTLDFHLNLFVGLDFKCDFDYMFLQSEQDHFQVMIHKMF